MYIDLNKKRFIIEKVRKGKRKERPLWRRAHFKRNCAHLCFGQSPGRWVAGPVWAGLQGEPCGVLSSPLQAAVAMTTPWNSSQWWTSVRQRGANHYGAWLSADPGEATRSPSRAAAKWPEARPCLQDPPVGVIGVCVCHWLFGGSLIFV